MDVVSELADARAPVREVLSFRLGDEHYGIDILKVQEIRGYDAVTRVANTADFIKGVIDLRGIIVPIVDLRVKFKLDHATYDEFTVVIILNVLERVIGIVVDSVSDVVQLAGDRIKVMPSLSKTIDDHFINGVGKDGDTMILLLDIERLMSSSDMELLDAARAN